VSNSLVSIIIPTFNRGHIIHETLDSIIAQTYENWECFVVDDGSTDDTNEVLQEYCNQDPRISYSVRPANRPKGANACRNIGLEKSNGQYIVFSDSDDVLSTLCLENRIKHFKAHEVDILVMCMGIFSNLNELKEDENRFVFNADTAATLEEFIVGHKLPWNCPRCMYSSTLIKNKIWFDEELKRFQDVDFNIRLLQNLAPKYISIDHTDCYYRVNEESINRYHTTSFVDVIFESYHHLYKKIVASLSSNEKEKFSAKIVVKTFDMIRSYYRKKNNHKKVQEILSLLKTELGIHKRQSMALRGIVFINRYYYRKKGYFLMIKKLKTMLNG